jgi:hypothetical protein
MSATLESAMTRWYGEQVEPGALELSCSHRRDYREPQPQVGA